MSFPINQVNERVLAPGWSGQVFVCDIDRTYLYTRFSSLKGLSRIPVEFAIDKMDIEGMVALLKEVRRGPERVSRHTPLYFISASPAQLRPVIERKMLLDGLEYDGTIFKDWWGVFTGMRLGRFKEQLGFKMTGLLTLHQQLPGSASELLMGDDLESDPFSFCLFADAVAGRVDGEQLDAVLLANGVAARDAQDICNMVRQLHPSTGVQRAYIRMERHEDAEHFIDFYPHLHACRDAFQASISLLGQGAVSEDGVVRVASDLRRRGRGMGHLDERLRECASRGLLPVEEVAALRELLASRGLIRVEGALPELDERWARRAKVDPRAPWTPSRLLRSLRR